MSEKSKSFTAESQKDRWIKYGANVALTVVVVLLLGGMLIYIAQRKNFRKDMTAGGAYSLKPQTVKLVENLPQKIKLVGLFTKARHEEQEKKVDDDENPAVRYQQVADLLQEYQQKSGGKVTVEMIDPITEPSKVDNLFNEVAKKYGNDVNKYNDVLKKNYPTTVKQIEEISNQEKDALTKMVKALQADNGGSVDRNIAQTINDVVVTVSGFPQILKMIQQSVDKQLELKVPDYKGAVDAIKGRMGDLADNAGEILTQFKSLAGDAKTPKTIKEYITASQPRFESLKKSADELMATINALGELKQITELRQTRQDKGSSSIAVMAENDMKVISLASLYPQEDARGVDPSGAKIRQRFAGEQQVTTALYTLTNPAKRKVAFIRSGGFPLTIPIREIPPFATAAARLRELDFTVLEKDVTGQWAMQVMQMQMQMQGMPPLPNDASDEELKDALWIVFDMPVNPQQMMQNPTAGRMGSKVAEHLKNGGSALIMINPQADALVDALAGWGIEAKPDYIMVHKKIENKGARAEDAVQEYVREQPFFLLKDYGDHMLTRPIQSLDGFFVPLIPISTKPAPGIKQANLLPIPTDPKPWAEHSIEDVYNSKPVEFTPGKDGAPGDVDQGPFYGGAAAENDKGGRVVVFGCGQFAMNQFYRLKDPQSSAIRFPGNGELFMNSIYWLSKMDTMIAISPSALEVPRVAPMSEGMKRLWQILLVAGLPALVLVAGASVYLKRRD